MGLFCMSLYFLSNLVYLIQFKIQSLILTYSDFVQSGLSFLGQCKLAIDRDFFGPPNPATIAWSVTSPQSGARRETGATQRPLVERLHPIGARRRLRVRPRSRRAPGIKRRRDLLSEQRH